MKQGTCFVRQCEYVGALCQWGACTIHCTKMHTHNPHREGSGVIVVESRPVALPAPVPVTPPKYEPQPVRLIAETQLV